MKKQLSLIMFSLVLFLPGLLYGWNEITTEDIEARIAALSEITATSASGHFTVVGTNRVESFALGQWCENAVKQIESISGIPIPFRKRRIVITVGAENVGGASVRYMPKGSRIISRSYLESYDSAYERQGRLSICCAILAAYTPSPAENMLSMPPWLWLGIEQNLLYDVRARNIEKALSLWRSGQLLTINDILSAKQDRNISSQNKEDAEFYNRLAAYSLFVRFLSSQPAKTQTFASLFSSKEPVTAAGLGTIVLGVDSEITLDEAWDRWLLGQSRVVRSSAMISSRLIEQLQSEMLLYPGSCGIPLASELPRRSPMERIVRFRKTEWLPQFVSSKRGRLNLIAAGHSGELAEVVAMFDEFLSGLESESSDILLLKQLRAAYAALNALAEKVNKAGGILYEKTASPGLKTDI